MMLQGHVEVMSFNLNRRGILQDSLDRLADLMTRLVAITPNVPEAKILLQKNAAKQAGFAGFCRQDEAIGPGAVNRQGQD